MIDEEERPSIYNPKFYAKVMRKRNAEAERIAAESIRNANEILRQEKITGASSFRRIAENPNNYTMADITRSVCASLGVSFDDVRGRTRLGKVARARIEAVCKIAELKPDITAGEIAMFFDRDRTTILYFLRKKKGERNG